MFPLIKKLHIECFFTLAFSSALVVVVQATPAGDPLPGPSGLGVIPTTQTVASGQFEASLNLEKVDISGVSGHARSLPLINVSAGFNNGEVGASYVRQKTEIEGFSSSNSYFALHGKYRVYSSPDGHTALAIGAHYYDFGSESDIDLGNVISLYATGSYEFRNQQDKPLARLHLGLLGQRSNVSGDANSFARPFGGVEVPISTQFSVAADYLAKQGDNARAYTLSARYQPAKKPMAAQIGIGRLRSDTKCFVGLTYAFGR